ncbi:MAG: DinB family protein [Bacillus sp. (in: firmicutes)]
MLDLFKYNWQVRDEWFEWCQDVPWEELVKKRIGGMGSILHTLYHVCDCEQIWINQLQDTPVIDKDMNAVSTLEEVVAFSALTRENTGRFLQNYCDDWEQKPFTYHGRNGRSLSFTYGKALLHIITHEIHHIGQLSVWSREIGRKPVSSDLLIRQFN